jgi:hypothetical protein
VETVRLRFDHGTPASVARQAVREALRAWGVADTDGDTLTVATELMQNVTQHTHNGGELTLVLRRESGRDAVLVECADADPRRPEPLARDLHRPGGRGLMIVAALARSWGTSAVEWAGHTGKVVWAELVFAAAPHPRERRPELGSTGG